MLSLYIISSVSVISHSSPWYAGPPSAPDQPLTSINSIHRINSSFSTVTLVWTRPEDNSDHISRYVMTVDPPTPLPANGTVESTDPHFVDREITVTLRHGQRYTFQVRADNCNNAQPGEFSSPLSIHLQGAVDDHKIIVIHIMSMKRI